MSGGKESRNLQQQQREAMARLERALIGTCDKVARNCPPRRPLRRRLFAGIQQALAENHRDMSLAAIGNPDLTPDEKHRLNDFNSAVYMYMYALCELAMDGSTQWDDPELLIDQYKQQLRRAIRGADGLLAATGPVDGKDGQKPSSVESSDE